MGAGWGKATFKWSLSAINSDPGTGRLLPRNCSNLATVRIRIRVWEARSPPPLHRRVPIHQIQEKVEMARVTLKVTRSTRTQITRTRTRTWTRTQRGGA